MLLNGPILLISYQSHTISIRFSPTSYCISFCFVHRTLCFASKCIRDEAIRLISLAPQLTVHISGHKRSLSLPHFAKPIRGDPTKGPLIRRTVLRIKAFIFRISPLKTILHGCFILSAVWVLAVYVTVCFGAPVLSDQLEVRNLGSLTFFSVSEA